jgi:UDP-N-acetylmuramoyl-tripeptide--D-alanyl-D-alanine ligase
MLTLAQAAAVVHGATAPATGFASSSDADRARHGTRRVESISTDTRTLQAGALFVALRGERFDGHAHLQAACDAGACAALVETAAITAPVAGDLPLIRVPDTRRALADLATFWRASFDVPVIVVAGSNGKTTTKDMLAAILVAWLGEAAVLATAGNLNNDIGLPLTVFRLRSHHRAAVFEIGMNHPGETEALARIAQARIALITNAQREHQEFMQDVDAVASEHALLIDALDADGAVVINADDPHAALWARRAGARRMLRFGLGADADVKASWALRPTSSQIAITLPDGQIGVTLAIPGLHNVRNALAAAAAATLAGCPPDAIARGLERFRPARGRLEVRAGAHGARLLDDTYNANPDSVRAAIDVLAAGGGATMLVLGDMGEVGEQASAFHQEVGDYARDQGIGRLFAIGAATADSAAHFGSGARHFDDIAALTAAVRAELAPGTTVLVKGSRFMRMERVIEALALDAASAEHPSIGVVQ